VGCCAGGSNANKMAICRMTSSSFPAPLLDDDDDDDDDADDDDDDDDDEAYCWTNQSQRSSGDKVDSTWACWIEFARAAN